MALTGVHFLLSYKCTMECDHCFLYCGPFSSGTFTLSQVRQVLEQARALGTVEWIYIEGGEPFMFYPLMMETLRLSKGMGFKVGLVTNSYFATNEEDAELWLGPLVDIGLDWLHVSDDPYHFGKEVEDNQGKRVLRVADRLGLETKAISTQEPEVSMTSIKDEGGAVVGGGPQMKGRAVDKLAPGLPTRPWESFVECKEEKLESPSRVHIDPFGNVHICQGIIMGNMWETPLEELASSYDPKAHPIVGPLLEGGPALLAKQYDVVPGVGCVSACHLCFLARRALVDRFPKFLAPRQSYGLEQESDQSP